MKDYKTKNKISKFEKFKRIFHKNKKTLTDREEIDKLKKLNLRFQIELILMFCMVLFFFFFNYNYMVFKVLISSFYTDTEIIDSIYKEENIDHSKNSYLSSFDNLTISVFMDRLYQTSGDQFTTFFNQGKLREEMNQIKTESEQSTFQKNGNTGILTLTGFSSATVKVIENNQSEINSCDNIVIDLRDNPGGIVKSGEKAAEYFLPKGDVIAQYITRKSSRASMSQNSAPFNPKHIYILQNNGTASAAELFINALRENLDNITILGKNSYGKGVGQAEMKLLGGYGIKATVMDILTPNGNSINHKGIEPDIEPEEDYMDYALNLCK